MKQVPLFIKGEWVSSKSDRVIDVTNPATQEVIAQVPCATDDEMQQAIDSANAAFKTWKEVAVPERARVMMRYGMLLKEHQEEIADIIDSVKCKQETPRKISSQPETLKEIRDSIKKHIKNTYLKKIEAPLQDKNNNKISPKLVAWMEIN